MGKGRKVPGKVRKAQAGSTKQKTLHGRGDHSSTRYICIGVILALMIVGVSSLCYKYWQQSQTDIPIRSEKWKAHKAAILKRYETKERNFDYQTLEWMANSDDPELLLIAASLYSIQKDPYAIKILENVVSLFPRSDVSEQDKKFTSEVLMKHYLREYNMEMYDLLSEICVQTMQEPENLYLHYRNLIGGHYHSTVDSEREKMIYYAQQCIETFKTKFPSLVPGKCYHYLGSLHRNMRNHLQALEIFNELFERYAGVWIDDNGKQCSALSVPLSVHSDDPAVINARKSREIAVTNSIHNEKAPCSTQKWAYYVQDNAVREIQTDQFFKMECHEAEAIIYDFPNVEFTDLIVYTEKRSKRQCVMYIPSFSNSGNVIDSLSVESEQQQHLKKFPVVMDKVILLQIYANYYHVFVEGSIKLYLITHHPALKNVRELQILAPSKPSYFNEIIDLFGLSDRIEAPSLRIQAKHVYDITWMPKYPPTHRERQLPFDIEEFHMPPSPLLREVRDFLQSRISQYGERNLVVFVHRGKGRRSINNAKELYDSLRKISAQYGMEFRLQGEGITVKEQMELFSRAVVVIGVHGAGLANILCCHENTAVLELPPDPLKTSVYSRMCSALNLTYYTIPHATFDLYKSREAITPLEIHDIEAFLHYALSQFTGNNE